MAIGETKYYWAWWVNVDPNTGRINKGSWGCRETEAKLIAEMTKRGMSRSEYEVYETTHYGESQVHHELNDLISQKLHGLGQKNAIDKAIQARYKTLPEKR